MEVGAMLDYLMLAVSTANLGANAIMVFAMLRKDEKK